MTRLRLTLLGGFEARLGSGKLLTLRRKKTQALLAYLGARPGQAHSRTKLATLLWGDTGDEQARTSLRQALFSLRDVLPATRPPVLLTEGDAVSLNASAVDVDLVAFERCVAERTPAALERGARLYSGDLLEGFAVTAPAFDEWLLAERERVRQRALEALGALLVQQEKSGPAEAAIQTALRLLALDPIQEPVHRALMRLYGRQGRTAAAVRQYQRCAAILDRELGVTPEAETQTLYQDLLRQRAPTTAERDRSPTRRPRRARPQANAPAVGRESVFVGRRQEVDRLRRALREAWRGQRQIVMILGEAGIGKTRLTEEVAHYADDGKGLVLRGRCYESEQILPFGPWVDAFRSGDILKDRRTLSGLPLAWSAELGRLWPELAPDAVVPAMDAADPLRLFEAVTRLVAYVAGRRPVLVILEDLHWADEMSLRLLSFIGRRLPSCPALFVGTAREEEVSERPMFGDVLEELRREQRLVELRLPPLGKADTMTLIRGMAASHLQPTAAAELAEALWAASGGNPFMVVESMRAVQDEDARIPRVPVLPQRVRDVIVARLERLPRELRDLVAVAAVIGRQSPFGLLQRVARLDEHAAADRLEALVRRRVLRSDGDGFDFTHDQIRAAAYEELLPLRRRLLHNEVADAIEAMHPDDLEPHHATLGMHYLHGETWPKALKHLQRAGARAATHAAHREAVACFQAALLALAHLPSSRDTSERAVDLRLALRNSLLPLGEPARILQCLREAEALAEAIDDRHRLGLVFAYLTRYWWEEGDHHRALDLGGRARAMATAAGDLGLRVTANFYLGMAYHSLGEYRKAAECHRWTVASLHGDLSTERFGLPAHPSVFSRTWLVWALAELGEFGPEFGSAAAAVQLAEAFDRRWDRVVASFGVGLGHLTKGDMAAAITVLERALALCPADDYPRWYAVIASHLGYALALSGRPAQAGPLVERGARFERSGHRARLMAHLAEVHLLAGRVQEALAVGQQALELSRCRTERGDEAWTLRLLGDITAQVDPSDAATSVSHYRTALTLADELGMRPLQAHCHLGLGRLHRRLGAAEHAEEHLRSAAAQFRQMDMPLWLARVEAAD